MFTSSSKSEQFIALSQILRYFRSYISVELGYSKNTVDAYINDVNTLIKYISLHHSHTINLPTKDTPISNDSSSNYQSECDIQIEAISIDTATLEKVLSSSGNFELLNYMRTNMMGNRTIQRKLSGLSTFFEYLVQEKYFSSNPLANATKPKSINKLPSFLTQNEIDALLASTTTHTYFDFRDNIIIQSLYASGMRVSELVSLTTTQVDLDRAVAKVIGKGNKSRFVPLYPSLVESLPRLLLLRKDVIQSIGVRDHGFIFVDKKGAQMTRQGCWYIIKKYSALAGITKNVTPHTLRHSFATNMLFGGADLRTIQMFLGHSSLSTTQIYTHVTDDKKRDVLSSFHPRQRRH